MWMERWHSLIEQLKQQGASVHPIDIQPVATEQELQQAEEQLGIPIPTEFRQILQKYAQQVNLYWPLPDTAILPTQLTEKPSGDFGWSLADLYFPDFGGEEEPDEQQYLQFYTAHNGDAVLIKLRDESIWYWSHEEDEFDFLAPSFHAYVDHVTTLGCIGVDCGQHRQFCDAAGLNPHSAISQIWLQWFEQYRTSSLQQAKASLESLLFYVSMHGVKDPEVQEAFSLFNKEQVYQALRQKLEQDSSLWHQQAWSDVLVKVCANKAEQWVRELWQGNSDIAESLRDYLTVYCLPIEEGLALVLQDIEKDRITSYTALHRLRHFHHPSVIDWMKDYLAFPIDGWDTLLAQSQPSAELLLEWLNGHEVERLTAIRAIDYMMRQGIVPTTDVEAEKWQSLLAFWAEHEVLRKNKQLFSHALNSLDSWVLKQ
ncbi:SMI1/KNR4 family protein [Lysinibacillus sp. NPDC098008]|uniref:SMI1/KNR4 family protein n=1 Tax=Lysinibacillus sp. NPDC098008 TaxID=3364146 RepID=UPI00381A64F1